MSILSKMKMLCNIHRQSTNVSTRIDSKGNVLSAYPVSPLYSNIKCYIQYLDMTSGHYKLSTGGGVPTNRHILFLKMGQDIKIGDKIVCSSFSPSEFYVDSVLPIIRPTTGKTHHIECILGIL